MARLKFLVGDVNWRDYGCKFYVTGGPDDDGGWNVVSFDSWESIGDVGPGGARYNVTVDCVRYGDRAPIDSALQCYGWHRDVEGNIIETHTGTQVTTGKMARLAILEALHSYGHYDRIADLSGNNWRKLMKEARGLAGVG